MTLALVFLCAVVVAGARSAGKYTGLIAFAREDGVYVMRADGTGLRHLKSIGIPSRLAWSPDGSRLAFATHADVWVMKADGSHLRRIIISTDSAVLLAPMSPSWRPNGRQIAFTAYAPSERGRDIWIVDADGTNLRRLARTKSLFEAEVTWSPTGNRIAFSAGGYVPFLYVMDADGRNRRELIPERDFEAVEPAWSPDGRRLAFRRLRGSPDHDEIYVTDLRGGVRVRLTTNRFSDREPAWSPDGRRIAFVRERPRRGMHSREILVMSGDGTGAAQLTHNRVADYSPAWQPTPR